MSDFILLGGIIDHTEVESRLYGQNNGKFKVLWQIFRY